MLKSMFRAATRLGKTDTYSVTNTFFSKISFILFLGSTFGSGPRFFKGILKVINGIQSNLWKCPLKHFECVSNTCVLGCVSRSDVRPDTEKMKIMPKAQRSQDSYIGKNT